MNQLAPITSSHAHAIIVASGVRAPYRFLEFFTANIRNPHTRRAYARAAMEFFDWLAVKGISQLTAIESIHVSATALSETQAIDMGNRSNCCANDRFGNTLM